MRRVFPLVIVLLTAAFGTQARAQFIPCGDPSLPPEQGWNPKITTLQLSRFYKLADRMSAALGSGTPGEAEAAAKEYLLAAKSFRCNWNYGNAIHGANSALGLLALSAGKKAAAALEYLKAAGSSPGSPQLNTHGPSMQLAHELARAGHRAEVAEYLVEVLRSIKLFWEMDRGAVAFWIGDLDERLTHTPVSWWRVSEAGWRRCCGKQHQAGLS